MNITPKLPWEPYELLDPLSTFVETTNLYGDKTWMTLVRAISERRTFVVNGIRIFNTTDEIALIQKYLKFEAIHIWRASMLYFLAWNSRSVKVSLRKFFVPMFERLLK